MSSAIIKFIGSVFVISAAVYFGLRKIETERDKIRELIAFSDMIKFIHDNILHFRRPLPEIFSDYRNKYLDKKHLLEHIRIYGIKESLDGYSFAVGSAERDLIISFSQKIGSGYVDDELNLCKYTFEKLLEKGSEMQNEMKNTEKMYLTIPVILALSVILILI